MGSNHCPKMANCFLAHRFDPFFTSTAGVLYYGRFLDDVILIYVGSRDELQDIMVKANSLHKNVHVNWDEPSRKRIFLDIEVSIRSGELHFQLYGKPFNRYLYLPFSTWHPLSCLKAWVIAEYKRIKECCTVDEELAFHHMAFKHRLMRRGYPERWINARFIKAAFPDPPSQPTERDVIPIIIPDTKRSRLLNLGKILQSTCTLDTI